MGSGVSMTEQPLALWLAELDERRSAILAVVPQFAPELRRLHARDKEWESVTGFMQTTTDRMESELRRLHERCQQLEEGLRTVGLALKEAIE